MVGDATAQREVLRAELGPVFREIIRDEVRGLLDVHPLGEGESPTGREAVPRQPRAMEDYNFELLTTWLGLTVTA